MRLSKLKVLSDDELNQIHEASLKILSETGMMISSQRALKLLEDGGAQVDFHRQLVRFPQRLVEDSLKSVPKKITFYRTRSKEIAFVLGDGKTHTVNDGDEVFLLDSETGKRRGITKSDVIQLTRIADALPNIDMILPPGQPQDVPRKATALHGVDAVLSNSEKPLFFSGGDLTLTKAVLEIVRVISGEADLSKHPVLMCEFSPTSPLNWQENAVECLIEVVKSGVPCSILTMPLSGVSAPFTLAGQLAINNAEVLSGIVISQAVKKGAPIEYAQCHSTFDMKRSTFAFASPEGVLMRIAGTQLAKLYGIPVRSAGFSTDSLSIDVQNGWENMLTGLCTLLIDIDLFLGLGALNTCLTISKEQLIIDNEIFEMISRLKEGISVSDETIATKVIEKVGPKGNYLCEEHTLKYLRTGEHWEPIISNHDGYDIWVQKGFPTVEHTAREKAEKILRMHTVKSLDQCKQREKNRIIERFESEIK